MCIVYRIKKKEKKSQPNTQDIAETHATPKDQSHANVAFKYSCALITLIPMRHIWLSGSSSASSMRPVRYLLLAPKVLLDYLRSMITIQFIHPIPSQSHPRIAVNTTSPLKM